MISENIVTLRKKYNCSQEEVAEKIGVTRQTIAKWENGESVPDVIHSNALAELFDITLDTLVNYENGKDGIDEVPPKGKYIFGTVTVGDKGQIVEKSTLTKFVNTYKLVEYSENELTAQQLEMLVGKRRIKTGWTSLVRAELAGNFAGRVSDADLDAIMVHLESEGEV